MGGLFIIVVKSMIIESKVQYNYFVPTAHPYPLFNKDNLAYGLCRFDVQKLSCLILLFSLNICGFRQPLILHLSFLMSLYDYFFLKGAITIYVTYRRIN